MSMSFAEGHREACCARYPLRARTKGQIIGDRISHALSSPVLDLGALFRPRPHSKDVFSAAGERLSSNAVPFPRPLLLLGDARTLLRRRKLCQKSCAISGVHPKVFEFRHLCRTVVTLLSIISEIEIHCKLGNKEQAVKIWRRMAEYNADAKDIFEARYDSLLN